MLHLQCTPGRRLRCACSRILQRARSLGTTSALGEVIVCWFGRLTSRLAGLACRGSHLPACQPGYCTSPSSPGRWLCPQSGSGGSAQVLRPPEASAHLHQSTPQCSKPYRLTSFPYTVVPYSASSVCMWVCCCKATIRGFLGWSV